jgi:hypothetical protein
MAPYGLAPGIIAKRMAMLADFSSTDAGKRASATAEWSEAFREKTVLGAMVANPLMWNPVGAAIIDSYVTGKMESNWMRLKPTAPKAESHR